MSALELDLACTLRILEHDNNAEQARFRMLASLLGVGTEDSSSGQEHVTVV